jgi:hypothetical protein
MTADASIAALNRLLRIHYRSLARYLSYASPTWRRGDERARAALQAVVDDQQALVERLGEAVLEAGGTIEYGGYPMAYTGYHDLSFDFLLTKLVEGQQRDIAVIESCVARITANPLANSVAEECLGAAKGHLETFLELQNPAPQIAVP